MNFTFRQFTLPVLTGLLLSTGVASAFPPAPYYTLYGMVRDQDGLPDTWEAWQLYRAGLYPDENGLWDLSLLDMQTWTRVPFAVGAPGVGNNAHQASDVGIVSAFTAPRSGSSEFFRLSVR